MDRYEQLRSFVLIADKGGFAAAAGSAGVTPVVMGRRLTALEERLGVRLMHRSTRGLRLTDTGAAFLERCRALLRDVDDLEQSVAATRRAVSGRLVVSAPAGFGRLHVAAHAPRFQALHGAVELVLHLADRLVDLPRERVDLAIRIGSVPDPNLICVPLQANRRVVCASPEYLARHGVPRTPDELSQHNCLALAGAAGRAQGWAFRVRGETISVPVRGSLACSDGELLTAWMIEGLGLGWRSTWEVAPALAAGRLVSVLDDYAAGDYPVQALYPAQRYVPARVLAFVEFLRMTYSAAGYWDGPAPLSPMR